MANKHVQAALLSIGVISSWYGMYSIYRLSSNVLELLYSGLWFILGFASSFTGLISTVISFSESDGRLEVAHYVLNYHYMCSWLTVVVGYPTLVTQFWGKYYPTIAVHILVALSAIPMVAWALKNSTIIVTTTQTVTGLAIAAHIYISYLAWNLWGILGAAIMILNIVALSVSNREHFLGISSREIFTVGIAAASYVFHLAISEIIAHPKKLKSLAPF